jgi:galactokinase
MNSLEKVKTAFRTRYNHKPKWVVGAPGRVNLIGEHTDYNDGFVLPMAIERSVYIALRPRPDNQVRVQSLDLDQEIGFNLKSLDKSEPSWGEYIKGVAWVLQDHGYTLSGWEGVLTGDVPIGAGLSSSAALELATARAFSIASGFDWQPKHIARLAQIAENAWVGTNCGIMDQMISAIGEEDHALLIDCRSLETTAVPLPLHATTIILDTGTRRGLVDSAYNQRRAQCENVATQFNVPALRDISLQQLEQEQNHIDKIAYQRARHVISENERVLESVEALHQADLTAFGQLMNASHVSMRDDFEISREEIDIMVAIAQNQDGCFGARLTGGGFGGCAVALVHIDATTSFVTNVQQLYQLKTGLDAKIYTTRPSSGARVLKLPPHTNIHS